MHEWPVNVLRTKLIFSLCPYLSRNADKTEYSVVQSGSGAPVQAIHDYSTKTVMFTFLLKMILLTKNIQKGS
jgi:hypothetical protein